MTDWFKSSFTQPSDASDENCQESKASTSSGGQTRSRKQGKNFPVPLRKYAAPQNWEQQPLRPLGSITPRDQNVTVFAVVSFFFPPKKTKGPHMRLYFGIRDSTLCDCGPLKCLCFMESAEDMPLIERIGDIIKLPLRISMFAGDLQGRTHDGLFPWMTFDGRVQAPIEPRFSRHFSPNFTESDKQTVERLKAWALSQGITRVDKEVTHS